MAIQVNERPGILCSLFIRSRSETTTLMHGKALDKVNVWARSADLSMHECDGPLGRAIRFIWTDNEVELLQTSVKNGDLNAQMEALLKSMGAQEANLCCGDVTFTFQLE